MRAAMGTMHPRGELSPARGRARKYGGHRRLRARLPLRDNKPMLFVAQLRLEDLAPYDPEALLPPRGLLSFFVADFEDPHVIYLEDVKNLVERTPPSPMMFSGMKWKAHPTGAGPRE